MAVSLSVTSHNPPTRLSLEGRSPFSSSSSYAMSPQFGHSCALTILKGDAEHPINAHAPIHQKSHPANANASTSPSQPSRFATSFSNLRSTPQAAASSGFDSSVNVHTISDYGILLPFLDRPSEVQELLFDTKANESLMIRLCSVFGGDPNQPTLRGKDERWDEMLELLIELDRPLLDDEDWLARLELLVMERSPSLWAQLARCLGADGLSIHPLAHPSSSRFDSWALPSRFADHSQGNDSPLSPPSAASSDLDHEEQLDQALNVNVEPLDALPGSYSEQPAGKLRRSSLREPTSPATQSYLLPPESAPGGHNFEFSNTSPTSPGEVFAMSAGADEAIPTSSLEDIMEEPFSSTQTLPDAPRRARSHSGKFAGLRISAFTSSSPVVSRRASNASESSRIGLRDHSGSPLPTGAMSPPGLAPPSPGAVPSRVDTTTTSFSRHRRLSTMMVHNQATLQEPLHGHDSKSLDLGRGLSPKASAGRRQRGVSEASPQLDPSFHPQRPRRRAESFARSFAELASPTEHLEQLRGEHAKGEADRLAESTRRISLETQAAHTSASAAPTDALGLRTYTASSELLEPASASTPSGKGRRDSTGRKRVGSMGSRRALGGTGPVSPTIPGLLPDGRTRHPSGSFGSRDLNESIATFRATMGLSVSPSPSERDFAETSEIKSDAGKSCDSATRKRKGSEEAESPKPTSRTAESEDAKVSRTGVQNATTSSTSAAELYQAQFQKPKHMQELENRGQVSGTSGSGLALGGGFSLAKSGANFRRQSQDAMSIPQSGWRSSSSRRDGTRSIRSGEPYPLRSPPAVQRRPGGFVSLAQEYERARQGRRSSDMAFSIHSNAVASSPSSSSTSFDIVGGGGGGGGGDERPRSQRRSSDESMPPRLELPPAREVESGSKAKQMSTPDVVKDGGPTPKAGPMGGGVTPRASFGASPAHLAGGSQEYPFLNLLHRMTAPAANGEGAVDSSTPARRSSLAPATPLSPLQACRTRLTPSPSISSISSSSSSSIGGISPRSPSIVFPISPNPSISRAQEFKKVLDTPRCKEAFVQIRHVSGVEAAELIRTLITSTEREDMHDEGLLEEVAHRLGLVDHERAQQLGGREAELADIVLAEQGYEERWHAFVALCRALGVGEYELGMARKRCGPAIDTCRQ